jgi:Asp-tRNA(Asn)/Glu-tRNA(Gln) amidotransferase A subunit family amidase
VPWPGFAAQWANDCSAGVAEVLQATLRRLQQLGAAVVDITLPDLHLVQVSVNLRHGHGWSLDYLH